VEAWAEPPGDGATNPALKEAQEEQEWPLPLDPDALALRRRAAGRVLAHLDRLAAQRYPAADSGPRGEGDGEEARGEVHGAMQGGSGGEAGGGVRGEARGPARVGARAADGSGPAGSLPSVGPLAPEEERLVASWDRDLDALSGELRRARVAVRDVPLPPSLSASQLLRLAADPEDFARELARPMPRPPRPAARRGTRFHAWVESRFEELPLPLLGLDEFPGDAVDESEAEVADERELAVLKAAFDRTPYARRTPYRVEAPFQLTLAGRAIRGRIDAVYRERAVHRGPGYGGGEGCHAVEGAVEGRGHGAYRYEIIDWKTNRVPGSADPLQLAVYRLAWAEQHGLPLSAVTAAFLYVRSGEVVRPADLPDRAALERLLLGE
jgi:DNA helicase-2/ATP-dependent DNA helicase PcrA